MGFTSSARAVRFVSLSVASGLAVIAGGVYALPADAVTLGTCSVKITSVGKGDSDQARMSADISCNKANKVRLETYLYVCVAGSCTLQGNPNGHQTETWSKTLTGTRTGYATNGREYCSVIASANVYYSVGGGTQSKGDTVSKNVC